MSPNAGLYDFDLRKFHFGSLQKAEFELELQTIAGISLLDTILIVPNDTFP